MQRTTRNLDEDQKEGDDALIEPDKYNIVEVCELLMANSPKAPEVAAVSSNKQYFEYVNMGAIKLVISF